MDLDKIRKLAGNPLSDKILYHGDTKPLTRIYPQRMLHDKSNNQNGIGVYFVPDLEIAKSYGPYISGITQGNKKIVYSSLMVSETIDKKSAMNFLFFLHKATEHFWMIFGDYLAVETKEAVTIQHCAELYDMTKDGQSISNWQIEMAQATKDINVFVAAWNRFIKIDALMDTDTNFYAVIQTNINIKPINF